MVETEPLGAEIALGVGDDAAVLRSRGTFDAVSVDTAVQGVHFDPSNMSLFDSGYRAFCAALSDLAAMGAQPRAALWSLIGERHRTRDLLSLTEGAARAATEYGCPIVGGNVSRGGELSATTTVLGTMDHAGLTRAGAQVGDRIFVTGCLGRAALGLRLLRSSTRPANPEASSLVEAFLRPRVRIEEGLALVGHATSCMDLSDGLLLDLTRLTQTSDIGAEIDVAKLPGRVLVESFAPEDALSLMLTGGEDYELLFTLEPSERCPIDAACIGRITPDPGVTVVDAKGKRLALKDLGFAHF